MTTWTASAYYRSEYLGKDNYNHHLDCPQGFKASIRCVDMDAANSIAAMFPKFVKVRAVRLGGVPDFTACAVINVLFNADGVNKGKNETGIKRFRKFVEIAGMIEWKADCLNSYKSIEDFTAAL